MQRTSRPRFATTIMQSLSALLAALIAITLCAAITPGDATAAEGTTSTVTSLTARWIKTSSNGTIDPDTGRITFTPASYHDTLSATAQFDLTSSGQSGTDGGETIPAGDLEWRIPAHLFTGRDGKPTGGTSIPVPKAPDYNKDTSLQYTYDEDTDEYVVTNATDIPAANTFSIQITYTASPGNVPDKDTTPDKNYADKSTGSISSSATIKGSDDTKTTPPLTETTDTGISLDSITKAYDSAGDDEDFLPESWVNDDGGAYVDGYRYVKWKIELYADGSQPGKAEITDTITDNLGGTVLGLLDEDGDPLSDAWEVGPYKVDIIPGKTYTYYVVTTYDKENLPTSGSYTFENSATGSVTGKDDGVTTQKTDTADQKVENRNFYYTEDQYRLEKYCREDGDQTNMNNCEVNGGLTALDNGMNATSAMFVNHYAAKTYGLTTEAGSEAGGNVYSAPSKQSEYGQKYVRHEFIDDTFVFGEKTPGEMEQNGNYPDEYQPMYGEPTKGYAKLQPDDFYISKVTILQSCSPTINTINECDLADTTFGESERGWTVYDWTTDSSGKWTLVPRDPWTDYQNKNSDKLQIYGLVAEYNSSIKGYRITGWEPMYASNYPNGGMHELAAVNMDWSFDPYRYWPGRIVGIKAVYQSATAGAVELNLGVNITLVATDHVKGLLKQLNDDKTASTDQTRDEVTLTDFNTLAVRTQSQIEQGTNTIAGFDWRQIRGDESACVADFSTYAGWHGQFNVLPFSEDEQYYDYDASGKPTYGAPWAGGGAPVCHATATQRFTPLRLKSVRTKWLDTTVNDTSNSRIKLPYTVTMGETGDFSYLDKGLVQTQQSGTFYDLLPAGVVPDTDSVKTFGSDGRTEMVVTDIRTYANYKNSGRILLVVKTKAPDGYINVMDYYSSNDDSLIKLRFDAYISWEDATDLGYNDPNKKLHNVVAYQTGNSRIARGDDNDDLDFLSENVLGTWWTDEEKATMAGLDTNRSGNLYLYAAATSNISFNTVSSSGLTKHVRGGSQIDWTNGMSNQVTVRAGGEYEYRLRYTPKTGTSARGIVLYDSLENYLSSDTSSSSQAVTESTPRWRGTLSSVNVQQAIDRGIAPKVYCSTTSGLNLFGPTGTNEDNRKLTGTSIWEDCTPATHADYDYSKVKAVAIDLSKTTNGGEATLAGGSSVQVVLVMKAPTDATEVATYVEKDAHAYNGTHVRTTTTSTGAGAEATATSNIDFGYTRVGLVTDKATFTFTKVDGSAGSSAGGSGNSGGSGGSNGFGNTTGATGSVTPLAGATFTIFRWVGSGSAPTSGLIDAKTPGPDWKVSTSQTSDADGKVSLGGLMVGTYRLVETGTPKGFESPKCQWAITVDQLATKDLTIHEPTIVTASGSGADGSSHSAPGFQTDGNGGYLLANYTPPSLPEAGGPGPFAMMGVGALMMLLSGAWFGLRRIVGV